MSMNFFGDIVTLVNRAPWPLNVRWDGRDVILQPGENPGFPKVAVIYAKNQNPLMGSEDPYDPSSADYLVGVKGNPRDKTAKLTAEELEQHQTKPQRLNRDILTAERGDTKSREVVRGRKVPSAFEAKYALSDDGGVVANSSGE